MAKKVNFIYGQKTKDSESFKKRKMTKYLFNSLQLNKKTPKQKIKMAIEKVTAIASEVIAKDMILANHFDANSVDRNDALGKIRFYAEIVSILKAFK